MSNFAGEYTEMVEFMVEVLLPVLRGRIEHLKSAVHLSRGWKRFCGTGAILLTGHVESQKSGKTVSENGYSPSER